MFCLLFRLSEIHSGYNVADIAAHQLTIKHICNKSNMNVILLTLLPRDALVHSAVLRLHVVRLSVCNVGGSGSRRLEILETNCTIN